MYADIKSNNSLDSEEVQTFFTDSVDFEEVETKAGKEFYVKGYISTHDKDLVNDIVTNGCMSDMLEQLKSRNIKLDVEHEAFKGSTNFEKEINKTTIPIAKVVKAIQTEKGIWIKALMNKAHARFEEVWKSVKGGFLDAFSIAFIPLKTAVKAIDGEKTRLLDRLNLLNIAMTGNPINPSASMGEIFMKSLYNFDIKNNLEVSDMATKKEAGDKVEGKNSEPSTSDLLEELKSLGERIEALEELKDGEESEPATPEKPPEDAPAEPAEKPEGGSESEGGEGGEAEDAEVKAIGERLESLEKEVKSILEKPILKSKVSDMKADLNKADKAESKSKGPLDNIV